ncbi:hypothetical protein GCM10009865_35510 [Aeromicrobium ponti]
MRSLMRSSRHRVHFIINDHYIRFVESDKRHTFLSYRQKCLPAGVIEEGRIKDVEVFGMILDEIVEEGKLKGSKITMCIPDPFMIVRKVSVPLEITEDELKGYLYMQLGETIHLPFDDPIIEPVFLGGKGGLNEVLLIATKESVIRDYTEIFEACSLKPVVADLSILSLYRFYYHIGQANKKDHVLMVQLGMDTLQLSVFHDHYPSIVRHSKLSLTQEELELKRGRSGQEFYIWNVEQSRLDGQARDINTEIERFMNFYRFNLTKGSHQITKLILFGDHPYMDEYAGTISDSFELQVQTLIQPLFQIKKGINIPPVFNDCIGLALK